MSRRFLAEGLHPVAVRGVVDRPAQARQQAHPHQRPARLELERALDHRDQLRVDHPRRLDVAPGRPDRGAGEAGSVAELLGQRRRLAERRGGVGPLAAAHPRLAQGQQQLAAPAHRVGLEAPLHVERAGVVLGRLLVGEHGGGLLGGAQRIDDGLLRVLGVRRATGEVMRQLGQVAAVPAPLRGLDRLPHALVDPGPARHRHPLVERLPDQRVGEQVVAGALVRLGQEAGRERLLERAEELVLGQQHDAFEQCGVDVAADHRRDAEQLDGRRLEPAEPPRDDLLDALGQTEALELRRARAAGVHPRLEQVADDLLHEERVALGLLVEGMGERARRRLAGAEPYQLSGVEFAQAADVELGREPVALQLGQRVAERVAAALGGAVRAQDQQPGRAGGSRQMAQEQKRRPVGPLEVVQHQQHGRRARQLGEQPEDRLEQPVALGLGLVQGRRREVGGAPAQLGDQPRQLRAVLARHRPQVAERRVQRPVPERLEDRLVGHNGLARRAPREHDRAGLVHPARELGGQRALPDAGVAGQQYEPARPLLGAGQLPYLLELGELRLAPDQRAVRPVAEVGGQWDPRPGAGGVRLGRTGRLAWLADRLGAQQPVVRGDRLGRRAGAELVAQQRPERLEHAHRLGHVAARRERLHQDHVARLAVGLRLDQRPRRALGRLQLRPAHHQAGAADHLQREQVDLLELAPGRLEPERLRPRQQTPAGDVERDLRQRPRPPGVPALEPVERARHLRCGRLDVDPDRLGEGEDQLVPAGQRVGPERGAQPAQQRAQGGVLGHRRLARPQRPDQLVAADVTLAVEHQVGQQQRDLLAAQPLGQLHAVDLHRQPSTKLDPGHLKRALYLLQRSGNVSTTS